MISFSRLSLTREPTSATSVMGNSVLEKLAATSTSGSGHRGDRSIRRGGHAGPLRPETPSCKAWSVARSNFEVSVAANRLARGPQVAIVVRQNDATVLECRMSPRTLRQASAQCRRECRSRNRIAKSLIFSWAEPR